jgi:hypothetical protein
MKRAPPVGLSSTRTSAAARNGVAAAVRAALAAADRAAYQRQPERPDSFWTEAEAWTQE